MRIVRSALIAPLVALAAAPAVAAEAVHVPPPPAQVSAESEADPFEDLYYTLVAAIDENQQLDTLLVTVTDQLQVQQPLFKDVERSKPGLMAKLRAAIRPVMSEYWERTRQLYAPRMMAMLREELTAQDARDLVRLYRSPVGQKVLRGASTNYKAQATIESALRNPHAPITADTVKSDIEDASVGAIDSLSANELKQFGTMALAIPALSKMPRINERIAQLRAELEETPMTPDEAQQLSDAIRTTIQQHLASAPDSPVATTD